MSASKKVKDTSKKVIGKAQNLNERLHTNANPEPISKAKALGYLDAATHKITRQKKEVMRTIQIFNIPGTEILLSEHGPMCQKMQTR